MDLDGKLVTEQTCDYTTLMSERISFFLRSQTVDTNIQTIIKDLTTKFGKSTGELAQTYVPTLFRLSLQEINVLFILITTNKNKEAHELLLAAMSPQELADQKDTLAILTKNMADANADAHQFWNAFVGAVIKACLTTLIPTVVL